jgi:hypothetical protein
MSSERYEKVVVAEALRLVSDEWLEQELLSCMKTNRPHWTTLDLDELGVARGINNDRYATVYTPDLYFEKIRRIGQPPTPWRKGSEWTEADGRVLCYVPFFTGPASQPTYAYTVRRCINLKWHWRPLPQSPQGLEDD